MAERHTMSWRTFTTPIPIVWACHPTHKIQECTVRPDCHTHHSDVPCCIMAKTYAADSHAKKSVRITITVPVEDHAELDAIAARKKVSVAWVVRDAIDQYLSANAPLFRRSAR